MGNYIRYWHKAIFVGIIVLSLIPATWADSGPAHRDEQQFPIQLGTSEEILMIVVKPSAMAAPWGL